MARTFQRLSASGLSRRMTADREVTWEGLRPVAKARLHVGKWPDRQMCPFHPHYALHREYEPSRTGERFEGPEERSQSTRFGPCAGAWLPLAEPLPLAGATRPRAGGGGGAVLQWVSVREEPDHRSVVCERICVGDVPHEANESTSPLSLLSNPMPQSGRICIPTTVNRHEGFSSRAIRAHVAPDVTINGSNFRVIFAYTLTLQVHPNESFDDLRRIRNKVFMTGYSGVLSGLASYEASAKIAMCVASPKVNRIGEDTVDTRSPASRALHPGPSSSKVPCFSACLRQTPESRETSPMT